MSEGWVPFFAQAASSAAMPIGGRRLQRLCSVPRRPSKRAGRPGRRSAGVSIPESPRRTASRILPERRWSRSSAPLFLTNSQHSDWVWRVSGKALAMDWRYMENSAKCAEEGVEWYPARGAREQGLCGPDGQERMDRARPEHAGAERMASREWSSAMASGHGGFPSAYWVMGIERGFGGLEGHGHAVAGEGRDHSEGIAQPGSGGVLVTACGNRPRRRSCLRRVR